MKASMYLVLNFVAQGCSVLFYLFLARSVSPASYGEIMAGVATALVVGGLLNFGSNTYFIRELSAQRIGWGDVAPSAFGRVLYSILVSAFLGLFFAVVSANSVGAIGLGIAILTFSSHLAQFTQVIPLAGQRIGLSGISLVIDKLLPLLILVAWTQVGTFAIWSIPIVMSVGSIASAAFNFLILLNIKRSESPGSPLLPVVRRVVKGFPGKFGNIVNPWRDSYVIGFASVFFSLRQLDVLVSRFASNAAVAGEYAAVARWVQPISMVASSIGNMTLPKIAAEGSMASAVRIIGKYWPIMLLLCFGAGVCALFSEEVVRLVLGNDYIGAASALAVLAISMPVIFIRQLSYILLVGRGLELNAARVVVTVTVVGLSSVVPLSVFLRAEGAAISFLATEMLMLVSFVVLIARECRRVVPNDC